MDKKPVKNSPVIDRAMLRFWKKRAEVLGEEVDRLREALTAIASVDKPKHDSEEYWTQFGSKTLATILATDTKIARNALSPRQSAQDVNK